MYVKKMRQKLRLYPQLLEQQRFLLRGTGEGPLSHCYRVSPHHRGHRFLQRQTVSSVLRSLPVQNKPLKLPWRAMHELKLPRGENPSTQATKRRLEVILTVTRPSCCCPNLDLCRSDIELNPFSPLILHENAPCTVRRLPDMYVVGCRDG